MDKKIFLAASPEDGVVRRVTKPLPFVKTAEVPCGMNALRAWATSDEARKIFGETASLAHDLAEKTACDLREEALQCLHFVKKSGKLVSGFETIKPLLKKAGKVAALLQACDSSPRERRRLAGQRSAEAVGCFTSAELGTAVGRPSCCHVAVLRGGENLWRERYELYKTYIDG